MNARICALSFAIVAVQPMAARADGPVQAVQNDRFTLDITERRIERGPYDASLEVGLDRPVRIRVGVALSTDRITLLVRGVHGDVQYHGDLSQITRIIAAHSGRAAGDKEKQ